MIIVIVSLIYFHECTLQRYIVGWVAGVCLSFVVCSLLACLFVGLFVVVISFRFIEKKAAVNRFC